MGAQGLFSLSQAHTGNDWFPGIFVDPWFMRTIPRGKKKNACEVPPDTIHEDGTTRCQGGTVFRHSCDVCDKDFESLWGAWCCIGAECQLVCCAACYTSGRFHARVASARPGEFALQRFGE